MSCHRTANSHLTPENFHTFHNTPVKIADRQRMLAGQWPETSCGYCKKIEESGGFSDRMLHLTIPNQSPPELETDPTAVNISPTILEVFLNNTCNLACLYCSSFLSSKIAEEDRKHGPVKSGDRYLIKPVQDKHYETLLPHFWKWFDENFHKLKRFHILGGEPFYQQETSKLLESIERNPNPDCELNIISNLMIAQPRLQSYIEKIKQLVAERKIKRFDLTASIDCWGAPQEYVRYGLKVDQWRQNFEYLLQERWIVLNINQTISPLTIKTMPELLELLAGWRKVRKVCHFFSSVTPEPTWLKPHILGPGVFDEDFKKIISLMPNTTEEENNAVSYMTGIWQSIEKSSMDIKEVRDMFMYLNEKDRRRGTNWRQVFPWLIEYEALCGITA
jgi:organic radical activating enzyme